MSSNNRIFVGNLSHRTTKKDLMQTFEVFGDVVKCDLKDKFAFIEYDSSEACKDAIYKMHHTDLNGRNIAVEMSHSRGPRTMGRRDDGPPRGGFRESFDSRRRDRNDDNSGRRDFRRDDRGSDRRDDSRKHEAVRSNGREHYKSDIRNYRVKVCNLSSKVSWQDLKDFAREQVGSSVVRTDVWSKRGANYGLIEFSDRGDYDYALDHLSGKTIGDKSVQVEKFKSESSSRSRSRGARGDRKSPRYSTHSRSKSSSRSSSRSSGRRGKSRSASCDRAAPAKRKRDDANSEGDRKGGVADASKLAAKRSASPKRLKGGLEDGADEARNGLEPVEGKFEDGEQNADGNVSASSADQKDSQLVDGGEFANAKVVAGGDSCASPGDKTSNGALPSEPEVEAARVEGGQDDSKDLQGENQEAGGNEAGDVEKTRCAQD